MAEASITEKYRRKDMDHMVRSLILPSEFAKTGEQIFVKGSGIKLIDTDGKEWIDISSGGLCVAIGYGNQELPEVAKEQMSKLSHCFTGGGRALAAEVDLACKLVDLVPEGLKRFQFVNSGSDANETAFKFARWYWREKGLNKYKIISLDDCYHGATYGALSAAGGPLRGDAIFGPFAPGFIHTATPYCYRCPFNKSYPGCDIDCASALEETIEKEGEDTVAAFIAEAVPKTISYLALRDYWTKVVKICKEHRVLLIIDEYITGFGRTGKFFASEHSGLRPDIMIFSKGLASGYLPIVGIAFSEEIYNGLAQNDTYPIHGFTYTGHAVCCAVALKNIEIMLRDKLVENAAEMGKHIQKRLAVIQERQPYIGDVRGSGLYWMEEPVADKSTKAQFEPKKKAQLLAQLRSRLREKGILAGALGLGIGLYPPLIITREEVDYVLDAMEWSYSGVKF